MKTKYCIAILLLGMAISFFLGRSTVKTKETIKFVKGETIIADYPTHLLTPKREIKGNLIDLPTYYFITDTIVANDTVVVYTKADTVRVFDDFMTKKEYDFTMLDNEYGRFDFVGDVQFNALQKAGYRFVPITKQVTVNREKRVLPFVSAGMNTFNHASVGGGFFYKNAGVEYEYLYDLNYNNSGHGMKIKFKF